MASEKRQLELDILANNKAGAGTAAAARDLDRVGTAADAAGHKVKGMGTSTTLAGKEAEKFGRESKDAAGKVDDLNDEIRNINRELVTLAVAFHAAGDAAERLDISKAIRRTENDLRRVTKSKGLLSSLLPDPDPSMASQWVSKVRAGINGAIAAGGPLISGGVILGTALAPTIGAGIAGAVLGGVGIGGIVGGMALAAKDPAISGYAKRIGTDFMEKVNASAKDVFAGPMVTSLNQLEALAARSAPKIGQIFKNSAPGVNVLVQALGRSADALLDSAVTASSKSQPAIAALGRMFQSVSEDVAGFVDMLSSHSAEGASALADITDALHHTADAVTTVIDGLATFKGWMDKADSAIDSARYSLEDHLHWTDLTADGYKKGSEAAQLYRKGIIGAAGSVNDYSHYLAGAAGGTKDLADAHTTAADAARGQRSALVALSTELRAEADPVFGLINAQDKLADAQRNVADATKKHGKNSDEAKKAVRDLALAAIDLQGKAGALGDTFTGKLSPSMRNTLRAAGLTEGEISAVAAQFRAAKRAGDAYAKTYRAKVITEYIHKYSNIITSSAEDAYQAEKKKIHKRASGGPVRRGDPYMVGEHGPELVVPNAAGRVLSAAATRGMASAGGARGGGGWPSGGVTAKIELVGTEEVRRMFRYMIRSMNLLETAA